jgi:hypothetical protein
MSTPTAPHAPTPHLDDERPAMTAQTAHTPARINPDHLAVLIVATVLTALLAGTSFMLSFAALEAVATWAAVPPALTWAVPAFIDAAILVYTLAALVARARGESARAAWSSLALWTIVSVTANALHAWADIPDDVRTIAGMTIAGLAPIAVLLATHTLADLVVAKPASAPDARTDTGQADTRADSGQRTDAPDPLVVLQEIESAPQTDGQVYEQTTDTTPDSGQADSGQAASAGQADSPPVRAVVATADSEHRTRPVRGRRVPGPVEAVRPQIEELARQGMTGREIARRLGTGPTRTCEIVREVREADALAA